MQILETFSGLEKYGVNNIKEVHINVGNLGDKDFLKQNYLPFLFSHLFSSLKIKTKIVEGTAKQNSFTVEGFRLARQFVLNNQKFLPLYGVKHGVKYLHVRKLDRQLVSDETYDKIYNSHRVLRKIDTSGDPIEDWRTLLNADYIIGAPSTFTLSTLLFNGNKRISVIPESMCDGPAKMASEHFQVIQNIMSIFPNLRWYKNDSIC